MIAEPGAPMAHATLMMTVSAIRASRSPSPPRGRPGETRLVWEALGAGYGASVVLVGPSEILAAVVDRLGAALRGVGTGTARQDLLGSRCELAWKGRRRARRVR
jgi:hypothetical protein